MSRRRWLLGGLALAAGLAGALWARPGAITAVDEEQPRLNLAAPVPVDAAELTQTFRPRHDGLSAIELLTVVYEAGEAEAAAPEALTLELRDAAGQVVAAQTFNGPAHNAPLNLGFPPQPHSAGQTYTLALRGAAGGHTTAWAYGLNGYDTGELRFDGAAQPGDLRFTTRYTYLWPAVLRDAAAALARLARVALPLWLVLFAPGLLLLGGAADSPPWPNAPARWGAALGLSLAVVGLLWLWIGLVGLRWSPFALGAVYAALGLAVAGRWLRARRRDGRRAGWRGLAVRPSAHMLTLLALLALGLLVRLLAARDLLLPQWVDGSHHYAIARVLAEAGQVPAGYAPLLPIAHLSYHFGFHALAVTLSWLTGQPLAETFMWLGQALQGLVPLAAYAAAAGLTGRARAGWGAAAFVALITYFPGYYLTWGRFTQLTGTLLLFPALALARRMADPEPVGRARWVAAARLGLLAAGLFVTHYSLFALWAAFVVVVALMRWRRALVPLLLSAGVGAVLAAPWLLRLAAAIARSTAPLAAPPGYNAFPWDYFNSPLERAWLALAGGALLWGLARRDRLVWLLALWGALVGVVVNLGAGNWLVTNNVVAIALFVPGALLLGWAADHWSAQAQRWLERKPDAAPVESPLAAPPRWAGVQALAHRLRPVAGGLMVAALAVALGYGAAQGLTTQVAVVNPATVLVLPPDVAALAWAEANLPQSAVVLVNSWEWLNGTWAGSDAGAWVWPLLGRVTTTPPADYIYGDAAWIKQVNDFNRQLREVTDAEAPATLALLRGASVTHVFIGARGGSLRPEMFLDQPHYQLLYSNGAAWVFAFTAAQSRVPK